MKASFVGWSIRVLHRDKDGGRDRDNRYGVLRGRLFPACQELNFEVLVSLFVNTFSVSTPMGRVSETFVRSGTGLPGRWPAVASCMPCSSGLHVWGSPSVSSRDFSHYITMCAVSMSSVNEWMNIHIHICTYACIHTYIYVCVRLDKYIWVWDVNRNPTIRNLRNDYRLIHNCQLNAPSQLDEQGYVWEIMELYGN